MLDDCPPLPRPRGVARSVRLSRRTFRTILQNLGWAFGYNVAALPLAVFGVLNPVVAGVAMACSSVSVLTNSLRLARFETAPPVSGPVQRNEAIPTIRVLRAPVEPRAVASP